MLITNIFIVIILILCILIISFLIASFIDMLLKESFKYKHNFIRIGLTVPIAILLSIGSIDILRMALLI